MTVKKLQVMGDCHICDWDLKFSIMGQQLVHFAYIRL